MVNEVQTATATLDPMAVLDRVLAARAAPAAPPAGQTSAAPAAAASTGSAPGAATTQQPDPQHAKAMEIVTKKEVALNKRDQALKALEAQWKDKVVKAEQLEQLRGNAKRDPGKYLKEVFGENWYENAVKYQLEGVPAAEMVQAAVDERLSKFEKDQQEAAQKAKEAETAAYQQELQAATAEFRKGITTYVDAHKEDGTSLISVLGAQGYIEQAINHHFNAEATKGQELPVEKAAEIVEEWLAGLVEKVTKLPKWAKRSSKVAEPQAGAPDRWETVSADHARGLTNSVGVTSETLQRPASGGSTYDRGVAYLERVLAAKA